MGKELAQWFFREVSARMTFLVEEYCFAPPSLEIEDAIHFATVSYKGKNLAIEFILDQRDEHFECDVSRPRDGERRDDDDWHGRDSGGALVRTSVFMLLRPRAGGEDLFHKPGGLPFKDKISVWLRDYERMLRRYGQDILEDSPMVLDTANID